MGRNLVICLDGTGGEIKAKGNSNVVLLYELLDRSDPDAQLVYYDPGVGTPESSHGWNAVTRALSTLNGLILGAGLRENLGDAYGWLMKTWAPGDKVFVFGFSRGAYSARSVSGILRAVGLLERGAENLIPYAVATYTAGGPEKGSKNTAAQEKYWGRIHKFADVLSRRVDGTHTTVPVTYLGLWDTVKSTGVLRWQTKWPYTRQLSNVAHVRHAVSIDEHRNTFRNYLVTPTPSSRLEEVWFAGIHSDIGGGFADDPRLAQITLKWVLDGAIADGLKVREKLYQARATVALDYCEGRVHPDGWYWALLGTFRRPIPDDAQIHASVRERQARVPGYRPKIPASASWVDEDWTVIKIVGDA